MAMKIMMTATTTTVMMTTAMMTTTCICHYHISIVGFTQIYFIYPQWDLPTTQKIKVLPLCWDGSAYQYDPLGEWVGWMMCRGCWMGGWGCVIGRDCWWGLGALVNNHQQCMKQPSQGVRLLLGGLGGGLGWGNFIFG